MKTNEISFAKNINKLLVCLGLSVAYFTAASSAYAAVAGHVQFVNGEVRITDPAGQTRPAQKGDAISEGDTLTSAQKSSAQIKMQDGGYIAVRPDTRLKFDQFTFAGKEDGSEKSFFSLFKGGFRAVTGLIGRINKQNYKITTPAATIGIRGTDHETVVIAPNGTAMPPGTYNMVNVGATSMTTNVGTVNVQPGAGMAYSPGMNQLPAIMPLNTSLFTASPPPAEPAPQTEGQSSQQGQDSQQADGQAEGGTQAAGGGGDSASGETAAEDTSIRETAVVDAAPPATGSAPAASTSTSAAASTATEVIAPPTNTDTVLTTATAAGGTTVDITSGTATTNTGQVIPVIDSVAAAQAQAAADAALAAANAAQAAAAATATADSALAAVALVPTTPATTAIGTASAGITSADVAVAAATALTPANPTTAASNAATSQATASAAAAQAAAAQASLTANGAFADSTAGPANTTVQSASSAAQSANTAVQTAATAVPAQNAALATAQGAATTALTAANANLTTADNNLIAANTQNAAITAAQGAVPAQVTAAQTAAANAQTAATAAQSAATQAASLQAAGDLAGAQAQLLIAQQELAFAQQQLALAQAAQTAVTSQLAAAQTAQTAASTAVTTAEQAAILAADAAATASAEAAAAQTAASTAASALVQTDPAPVSAQAAIVAANAPVAAYNNPAVATPDRFVGVMSTVKADAGGGYVEGYGPGAGFGGTGTANTSFVLDGTGNLVEKRNAWYEETAASTATPQLVVPDANVKRTGGTAVETFKMPDNSIYAGRWVGGTLTVTDNAAVVPAFTRDLGVTSEHWAILLAPPAGYVQTLTGTVTYNKVGATSPTDALGNAGLLNGATLTANFTSQLVDATLNLTIAGKTLDVLAAGMVISGSSFSTDLQVTATCAGCGAATYYANVGGGFAGDAAASAGLNYTLWTGAAPGATTGAADLIQGMAAFSAATTPVVTPIITAPYAATNTAVAYTGSYGGGFSFVAAPGEVTPLNNPTLFTENYGNGSGFRTDTLAGATTATPPATVMTAGGTSVTYGVWETVSSVTSSEQHRLEPGFDGKTLPVYMYGAEGYLDSPVILNSQTGPLIGTFSYAPVVTTSFQQDTWATGSVGGSMSANFTNQTVSIALNGTMGANSWTLNSSNRPISFMGVVNGAGAQFFDSAPAVTLNAAACPTCVGNINGAFVGQNYAGAIVQYGVYDNSPLTGMNAGGLITFDRMGVGANPTVINSAPAPTGLDVVAAASSLATSDPVSINGAGVLTGWGSLDWSSTVAPAAGSAAQTAVGTGSGTINWGTWAAGSIASNDFVYIPGMSQFHWITAPEPTPVYLAEVLTTTNAQYALVGGDVTSLLGGVHGTVNGTTSLTANFTTQTIAVNLALTVNGHNWAASTSNAPLQSLSNSNSATGFYADSRRLPIEPGYLTVTVDGTAANGSLAGQLVGAALDGAILKFNLDGLVTTPVTGYEFVQGVAALEAVAANDPATPYRMVAVSLSDPMALVPTVQVNGSYNNAARVIMDGSGNLMQFDDNSGGGKGTTIQYVSGGLADQGSAVIAGATVNWGRWTANTQVMVTDRATGATQNVTLVSGAHAVIGPLMTGPVALPTTGVYGYTLVGNTTPTTDTGASGTFTSASLQANFTTQTVDVGVNVTAASATLSAAATNVPIQNRAMFYTDSRMTGPGALAVTCSGACGTTNHGAIGGGFGGPGGAGAAITYGFQKGGVNAGTVSGVAVFQQGAQIPQ